MTAKFCRTNKIWEPNKTHHTVSTFLEKFKNDIILELDRAKPQTTSNLTAKEQIALENLTGRSDILICKADKGGATVIWDVKNYIEEANNQLSNGNFYRKLCKDPTVTHLDLVNNAIDTLQRHKHLGEKLADGLKLAEAKTPKLYLLPEILIYPRIEGKSLLFL